MTQTNDSFIDEVAEEVRRDQLSRWLRRWGWLVGLGLVLLIGGAAWLEWRQARDRAMAEMRGDLMLAAIDLPSGPERLAILQEAPADGPDAAVRALWLAAEQQADGDLDAARATLAAIPGGDSLYRDLAALKSAMIAPPADAEADAALDALAAGGGPFRLLALETRAARALASGDREEAATRFGALRQEAGLTQGQVARIELALTSLGVEPPAGTPAGTEAPLADPEASP